MASAALTRSTRSAKSHIGFAWRVFLAAARSWFKSGSTTIRHYASVQPDLPASFFYVLTVPESLRSLAEKSSRPRFDMPPPLRGRISVPRLLLSLPRGRHGLDLDAAATAISPIFKHGKAINWAAFNLDGSELVTVGPDRFVRVSGILAPASCGLNCGTTCPCCSPSSATTANGLRRAAVPNWIDRGEVRVWNLDRVPPTPQTLNRSAATVAKLTPDGKSIVAINARRAWHLWSLDGTNKSDDSSVVEVNPLDLDGYSGTDPTHVLRLNGVMANLRPRPRDRDRFTDVPRRCGHGGRFQSRGNVRGHGGRNHTVRVWDAASASTPPLWHGGMIRHIAFSKNGQRLLTTAQDGLVRVWELPPRESPAPLVLVNMRRWRSVATGARVATVDPNGAVLGARPSLSIARTFADSRPRCCRAIRSR